MGSMSPREVERLLGEQYAEVLARAPREMRAECKEIINNSLELMEHANRVSLALQAFARRPRVAPVPVAVPVEVPIQQQV